MGGM